MKWLFQDAHLFTKKKVCKKLRNQLFVQIPLLPTIISDNSSWLCFGILGTKTKSSLNFCLWEKVMNNAHYQIMDLRGSENQLKIRLQ